MSPRDSFSADRIGEILRQARIEQGYATEEVAWRLKVRPDLIRTLERRDPTALGQPALVRSHLLSYVRFLGLDEDLIVAAFDAEAEFVEPIEELKAQARRERRPPKARWIVAAAVSGLALATAAFAGFLGSEADPVLPSAASSTSELSPADATIRLSVAARRDTRVSVQADGVEVFDGTLPAGIDRDFNAREVLGIVAADGGALDIAVNGRKIVSRGTRVFSARFGPGGRRL